MEIPCINKVILSYPILSYPILLNPAMLHFKAEIFPAKAHAFIG